ncbi:MAG: flagella synthesis protein FlgN [Burkholderiales bacterium]
MSSTALIASALGAALRSERAGVQALLEALTEERALLASREIDRLAEIAARKRGLLLHVANLGDYRKRLLDRAGIGIDRSGLSGISHGRMQEVESEWQALVELTRKAHRLNQENGAHIEAGMLTNQQALSVLMSAVSSTTYGPGGRTSSSLASRSLTSA